MLPLKSISAFILLIFTTGVCLHAQQLHVKSWKKKKEDRIVPLNTLVSVTATTEDSAGKITVYGYFKGADTATLHILPLKTARYQGYSKVYEQSIKDTGILEPVLLFSKHITSISIYRKPEKERLALDVMPVIVFVGVLGLAPLTSVNHTTGIVNSSLYGWLALAGYFSPMIISGIVNGVTDVETRYSIIPAEPAKPTRHEYHLVVE